MPFLFDVCHREAHDHFGDSSASLPEAPSDAANVPIDVIKARIVRRLIMR
jgi:hypothetical protein